MLDYTLSAWDLSNYLFILRPKYNVISEANAEFGIRAEITDLAGHGLHRQTLTGRGPARVLQQSVEMLPVGGFAEEQDEEDHPDAPVDKVENLKDRVVQVCFIKPANHEGGALG